MYKKASKLKLRVSTPKGLCSVEQLWSLNQKDLAQTLRDLHKSITEIRGNSELSILEERTFDVDPALELSYDIVKDIYTTKKAELDEAKDAAAAKQHNQKILEIISAKEEEDLKSLSVEELKKRLK